MIHFMVGVVLVRGEVQPEGRTSSDLREQLEARDSQIATIQQEVRPAT